MNEDLARDRKMPLYAASFGGRVMLGWQAFEEVVQPALRGLGRQNPGRFLHEGGLVVARQGTNSTGDHYRLSEIDVGHWTVAGKGLGCL